MLQARRAWDLLLRMPRASGPHLRPFPQPLELPETCQWTTDDRPQSSIAEDGDECQDLGRQAGQLGQDDGLGQGEHDPQLRNPHTDHPT